MISDYRNILALLLVIVAGLFQTAVALEPIADTPGESHYQQNIVPFLNSYCIDCHSGDEPEAGIDFDRFSESSRLQDHFELWEHVERVVQEGQMPPADANQPTGDEILSILESIEVELASFDCGSERHPGRVTVQRLNRIEYDNTIRDLTGLDLHLADDFPADDVGEGFDNIGDVLSLPPVLLEKYFAAAEIVAARVMDDDEVKKQLFPHVAKSDDERVEVARQNVREFAERAFRRPLTERETERLFELLKSAWEQDATIEEIFETAITAILTHPSFLFRIEADPSVDDKDGVRGLNGYELASRLSYFLWSSMPDAELFRLAENGDLADPNVLRQQALRMLADPKSVALVDNFAGQWLQLRDVSRLMPDPEMFPTFDSQLRDAMRRETEIFFEKMMSENRSLLDFLTADYSYVNERLAKHYGMVDVAGDEFQRVELPDGRRGVLTHASILFLTSNPTRTSPVKRGKWVLDNILAEPPPAPPANVPELGEAAETLGSLREQMEQHRSNPACAACHRKMDAIGFGMENFDAIGSWRDRDGRFQIDPSGQLPGGREFENAADLMQILADEKKDEFVRCLTRRLMTYALGRGLTSYDRCTVTEILEELSNNDYRFHTLVTEIVTSDPFTMRERRRPTE